jgi:hypothetical protein
MFNYKYGVKVRKARKIRNFKQDLVINEKLFDVALEFANAEFANDGFANA